MTYLRGVRDKTLSYIQLLLNTSFYAPFRFYFLIRSLSVLPNLATTVLTLSIDILSFYHAMRDEFGSIQGNNHFPLFIYSVSLSFYPAAVGTLHLQRINLYIVILIN